MPIGSLLPVFGLAGALGVAVLGAVSLLGGRARPRGAFAFALFALLWGVQVALGSVAYFAQDEGTFRLLMLLMVACLIALPYFLVEFVASWVGPSRWTSAWRWGTVTVAALGALAFVLSPSSLLESIGRSPTRFYPIWGSLHVLLVGLPFFLAFAIALPALAYARARAPTPRTASRVSTLLAGLGVYVSFTSALNLWFYARAFVEFPTTESLLFALVFLATVVSAIVVVALLVRSARLAPTRGEARRDLFTAAALGIPLLAGTFEAMLALDAFETTAAWRVAGVGILTYGIARWRMYDLPQRATSAAATATGATAAVATGAAAFGAGTIVTTSVALPVVVGLVALGAMLVPAVSFARRMFGIDAARPRRDLGSALYGQRIDAYRAALEASLARNSFDEDREFLAALRERFQISQDEDRLLTHLSRASVIVSRDRQAWDAYERLRLLGEGGGGRTWLARDRARDRLVVLKEPLERWQQEPAAREAVLREARLAAKVRHPNVVAVEAVVEGKGSPVIVMEYLEGGSLADVLRSNGPMSWTDARATMLDVLAGLEAIHAGGIVHRDIKPSNILLAGEGVAKVADFGIAVTPGASGSRTVIIDPAHSTIAGTLHYMAPEARQGGAPDRRADVYACAAVLHEMLYGAPPGLPSPTLVRQDLPAGLPALLARGLAPVESRFPSARAFADELARLG